MKVSTRNLIALFVVLGAGRAQAFTLDAIGSPPAPLLGWNTNTINFDIDYTNCGVPQETVDGVLDAAFSLWNGVPTSDLVLGRGSQITSSFAQATSATASGNPQIICDTHFTADSGGGDIGDISPGYATDWIADSNSKILYASIVLNAEAGKQANIASFPQTILQIVIAHEIGHVFGLGHSEDKNALMYFDASAKTTLALSQDDVDGVTWLYPRKELSGDRIFGCGSLAVLGRDDSDGSDGPGGSGSIAAQFFALLGFCFLVTRNPRAGQKLTVSPPVQIASFVL